MTGVTQTYASLREAKRGVRVIRTTLAALDRKTPAEAKAWLERDAERTRLQADEMDRLATVAASQLDLRTGRPVGMTSPEAQAYARRGNALRRLCGESFEAANDVHQSVARLNERLDRALGEYGEWKRSAEGERRRRAK